MIRTEKPVCVAPVGDRCGEGAVWHARENALYWTDINRFLIHRYSESDQSVKSWFFDEPVTSLTLTDQEDTLTVVFASRAVLWHPNSNGIKGTLFQLSTSPKMRCNDARADSRGSLWVGTMRNNVGPNGEDVDHEWEEGVLYRIDPDGSVGVWQKDIGISNTVAWSPDRKYFYFADTPHNIIYRYSYDSSTGTISDRQVFFEGHELGLPDGSAVDAEGYLWNCRPGAACILRIAPDGSVDDQISLPILKPTTCTFGGPDLRTLYITSACSADRLAGGLFAIRTGVKGQIENRFRIDPVLLTDREEGALDDQPS
jgi:sugar lactone lactonase YvrE